MKRRVLSAPSIVLLLATLGPRRRRSRHGRPSQSLSPDPTRRRRRGAKDLGQQIIVENKPGAAGQIEAAYVVKARPNGYTMLVDASSITINPGLYPRLPYDQQAFRAVAVAALFPHVVVVTPGHEVKSATELVVLAKIKPDAISVATASTGSAQHLVAALFQKRTSACMLHVSYKGATQP